MYCWDIHKLTFFKYLFINFHEINVWYDYLVIIWIVEIFTSDFFQVLILNSSNSERLTHTNMRFPGFYGFWSFEFEFVKFIKTHSHQHAISQDLRIFKSWIWICQIQIEPSPDWKYMVGVWKKNINSRLTPLIFKIGRRKGYLIFLITVGVWKKNINSRLTPLIFKIGRRKWYLIFSNL